MANISLIPLKSFGKTGIQISAIGLGGHHLGTAEDEKTAIEIIHRAVDGGVTFFDCCWEYNRGKSEDWLGKGVKGLWDKIFLMTKVCTHGRDAAPSMSRKGNCWDTQSNIPFEPRPGLTLAGIGHAAFALTCRPGSGVL